MSELISLLSRVGKEDVDESLDEVIEELQNVIDGNSIVASEFLQQLSRTEYGARGMERLKATTKGKIAMGLAAEIVYRHPDSPDVNEEEPLLEAAGWHLVADNYEKARSLLEEAEEKVSFYADTLDEYRDMLPENATVPFARDSLDQYVGREYFMQYWGGTEFEDKDDFAFRGVGTFGFVIGRKPSQVKYWSFGHMDKAEFDPSINSEEDAIWRMYLVQVDQLDVSDGLTFTGRVKEYCLHSGRTGEQGTPITVKFDQVPKELHISRKRCG